MSLKFDPKPGVRYPLPAIGSWPKSTHCFDQRSVWAIQAALAAGRPLLVRGEPGLGKSQLARAAAEILKVPFLSQVINARSDANELLYSYDAVSRLAQAQVLGSATSDKKWEEQLEEKRFILPGILWWAFDWLGAREQANRFCRKVESPRQPPKWNEGKGCVVLIDEIDKADSDFPNGLLESLGNTGFLVPQAECSVSMKADAHPPLVVVTTNEERELPTPFLRRCLVLQMRFPSTRSEQTQFLIERGRAHFTTAQVSDKVCEEAARQLLDDREAAQGSGLAKAGAAEYLDLLRALVKLAKGRDKDKDQLKRLEEIREFVLRKNPEEAR